MKEIKRKKTNNRQNRHLYERVSPLDPAGRRERDTERERGLFLALFFSLSLFSFFHFFIFSHHKSHLTSQLSLPLCVTWCVWFSAVRSLSLWTLSIVFRILVFCVLKKNVSIKCVLGFTLYFFIFFISFLTKSIPTRGRVPILQIWDCTGGPYSF